MDIFMSLLFLISAGRDFFYKLFVSAGKKDKDTMNSCCLSSEVSKHEGQGKVREWLEIIKASSATEGLQPWSFRKWQWVPWDPVGGWGLRSLRVKLCNRKILPALRPQVYNVRCVWMTNSWMNDHHHHRTVCSALDARCVCKVMIFASVVASNAYIAIFLWTRDWLC